MKKKKLFSVLSAEGKSSIFNPGFAAGVLLLTVVFVTAGYSYMEYLLEMGGSVEGAPWIVLFTYCISSDQSLLLLPLFVPLAASGNAQTELKSRFCLFLAERSGKKEYLLGKVSGAAISGGLMTLFSYILTLCIVSIACMNITDVSRNISELPVWNLIFEFLCGFLNGALWSLAGSAAAVLTKNSYLAYASPFIFYYVMTMFQERYYENLYFLSPKQWAFPSYYGTAFCVFVLLFLDLALSGLLIKSIERRLLR